MTQYNGCFDLNALSTDVAACPDLWLTLGHPQHTFSLLFSTEKTVNHNQL